MKNGCSQEKQSIPDRNSTVRKNMGVDPVMRTFVWNSEGAWGAISKHGQRRHTPLCP